jgi:hypothetical protein
MPVRIGFKLFENGNIESVEPAEPFRIENPIGSINAYDADALGIDADKNSVGFDERGRLTFLTTFDIITVRKKSGEKDIIFPKLRLGLIDEFEKVPVKLIFDDGTVSADNAKTANYKIAECTFLIMHGNYIETKSCDNCSSCKGCM